MILLVGGYGESPLVQETFRNKFANLQIIIPQDCNLAVMKGAVLYGHNPLSISARILRFSYGIRVKSRFDPEVHPWKLHYVDPDGASLCRGTFSELISKNTKVSSTGIVLHRKLFGCKASQSGVLPVYCTEKENTTVVDDSCQLVGELNVSIPRKVFREWHVHTEFIFGLTEIKVSATVRHTNETFKRTMDLLE